MPKQDISIRRTDMQNKILELEKKYFSKLEEVFTNEKFLHDLLFMEKEIRENYPKFASTWNLKNKFKVPAERIVRHYVYILLNDIIKKVYPSPISSDLGIQTNDCVLCIDVKTVDTVGNKVDIGSTQVEPNQISFKNTRHKYIQTSSNLDSIDHYSRVPVLTYVIKFIYTDDDYSFKLSRGPKPSMVLACIPNGELSELFGNDIIKNFKTYDYHNATEDAHFTSIPIPKEYKNKKSREKYVEDYCLNKGFSKIRVEGNKPAYYDSEYNCIWWLTSEHKKPVIRAVKSGSSTRLFNDILKERYDSHNNLWCGYKELPIPEEF